jgi:hypothetical protein
VRKTFTVQNRAGKDDLWQAELLKHVNKVEDYPITPLLASSCGFCLPPLPERKSCAWRHQEMNGIQFLLVNANICTILTKELQKLFLNLSMPLLLIQDIKQMKSSGWWKGLFHLQRSTICLFFDGQSQRLGRRIIRTPTCCLIYTLNFQILQPISQYSCMELSIYYPGLCGYFDSSSQPRLAGSN